MRWRVGLGVIVVGAAFGLRPGSEASPPPMADGGLVAHRGGRAHGPDNSLAAMEASAIRGADAVELDVFRRPDGVLVCARASDGDPTRSR